MPEFEVPAVPSFQAPFSSPTAPKTNSNQTRFSHYLATICEDLDRYEVQKQLGRHSVLKIYYQQTLVLDLPVARKIASLVGRLTGAWSVMDRSRFQRVVQLLVQAVQVASELDPISHYRQHQETVLAMLPLIGYSVDISACLVELLCYNDPLLISPQMITHCLQLIKNQLDYLVYPLMDLDDQDSSLLHASTKAVAQSIQNSPAEISQLLPSIVQVLQHIDRWIQQTDLDDELLVTLAYICMGPFFHQDQPNCFLFSETFSAYDQLKLAALGILKHLFSFYPHHRRWIFEEILTSLGSLTVMNDPKKYQLTQDQSIHVISALFMELVQACAALPNKISHQNWFKQWHIKYQKACKHPRSPQPIQRLHLQLLTRATNTWRQAAEAAANSASFFLEFLMSKCKSKRTDTYSLIEYRWLLTHTLEDIMTVFNDPAWPVAELIMKVFSRILISLLEGHHSDQYLKSLAVEWLGIIACKIKKDQNKLTQEIDPTLPDWIYELQASLPARIEPETDRASMERLGLCRKKLLDTLRGEHASVVQFYLCHWGFTESVLWTKANQSQDEDNTSTDCLPRVSRDTLDWLQETCKFYWQRSLGLDCPFPNTNLTLSFPDITRKEAMALVEILVSRQSLYTTYDFILTELLTCLDKEAAYLRTKSLRAIKHISAHVPEILEEGRIRTSVVQRIHDTSPSVRDAAVEVIAKYLSQQTDVSLELYRWVSSRIMDTAVTVRKRLVKLLGELYFRFSDTHVQKDMASKLMMRLNDNEVTVSQLALKVTQKILFSPFKEVEKDGNDYFGSSYANATKDRKRRIDRLTDIIVGAVAQLTGSISTQSSVLNQILQKTMDSADQETKDGYERIFQWIIDSLFDRLMQLDQDHDASEFVHCLATLHSFTKTCPNLLREVQITLLQPYLSISKEEHSTTATFVLMIYRDVLPQMKHHNRTSIELLERILLQLLTQCPLDMIAPTTACLCVIVSQISHRYNILIKILGSSVARLRQVKERVLHHNLTQRTFSGVLKMILLCGLVCQHFEFDQRREQEPTAMAALDLVSRDNIAILVYDLLTFFMSEAIEALAEHGLKLRMAALQSLGYFYTSYPTYMISEASTQLMDTIFREGDLALQIRLMHVFQEFLAAEEGRIEKREGENTQTIGIDTLLGNTKEYAELGVNGSLMQRYLPWILKCALSEQEPLRYPAFEVIATVIQCGLAHPVLCMPVIVAAETSPDLALRTKAYYLHKYAHDKYGTLLYIQINTYIATSFQYQHLLFGSQTKGFGKRGGDFKIESVLSLTYSILKEHKKTRFDFFLALLRPFSFELKTTTADEIDLLFLTYLAENLMRLEFTTTNEVLFVVYHMDRLLTSLGADLLSHVQLLKKQGRITEVMSEKDDSNLIEDDLMVTYKLSIALSIIMLLKKLLIELYDIPDQEIREYNPNHKRRSRDVVKDTEMSQSIEWAEELFYFQHSRLDLVTGAQACSKFEYLIISDTTAIVTTDAE
ncbi:sister chromatid cohesion C-terminus-domain-containing protein [Sporodiniella umbellata]|nr:sister chromatid cohesion C-terminus-domain-containing protein [Sporodiniella umbellata]